jgi:four helix bundle protein
MAYEREFSMSGFKDLKVWSEGKQLAVDIYRFTGTTAFSKDFGLRDQMRRAAVSVPSNIAEGDERDANKDSIRFFNIAKGSLAELRTQLAIACEIGYIDSKRFQELDNACVSLGKRLGSLIKARGNVRAGS